MGANKSKLIANLKGMTVHSITDLPIDNLFEEEVLHLEMPDGTDLYDVIQTEVEEVEEGHSKSLKTFELFKRNSLINFTDSQLVSGMPNVLTHNG
jgi:hypothetical protein